MSTPSKIQVPVPARSNPVNTLKNVVLPAPFGPMSAVIRCRGISRCSTATASRPPKLRVMSLTTRIGLDSDSGLVTDHHLATRPEEALRSEDDEQHDQQPDEDEAHRADLRAGQYVRRAQEIVRDGLAQKALRAFDEGPERDRSEYRPPDGAGAAENHGREREERDRGLELVRLDELAVDHEHDPADRADHAAEHQALHLVREHVLAERSHGVFVLSNRTNNAPPRTLDEQRDEERSEHHQRP